MLTEFGGLALPLEDRRAWGYLRTGSVEEFGARYRRLLEAVRSVDLFAGFCYTQFADTYQEQNGLLYADRTPKIPLEEIAEATTGTPAERAQQVEETTDMLPPGGEGSRHGQAAAVVETSTPLRRRPSRRHGS
jgi:hypothetical protein